VNPRSSGGGGAVSSPSVPSVGIVSCGMYLPEPVLTATEIAGRSGVLECVVRDKLGIEQKHMAGGPETGGDDHPNQMTVWAAQDCLAKTDIPPEEIDVVLCTTEEWREYSTRPLDVCASPSARTRSGPRCWAITPSTSSWRPWS
jgi:3-oxoacyl-[acyl-carrier-protein] synthase-3